MLPDDDDIRQWRDDGNGDSTDHPTGVVARERLMIGTTLSDHLLEQ